MVEALKDISIVDKQSNANKTTAMNSLKTLNQKSGNLTRGSIRRNTDRRKTFAPSVLEAMLK